MSRTRLSCLLTLIVLPAFGQPREFDAVSVKPASQVEGLIEPIQQSNPGRLTLRNYVVKKLVMEAYGLTRYQVEGPRWIEDVRYDIIATKPPGTTAEGERVMLQTLLAARFGVVQHWEKRELPAYALLPGKDSSKLHPVKEAEDDGGCNRSGTMARLAENLATILDKPVIDQTGIAGRYYFILVWPGRAPAVRTDDAPPPPPPAPSSSAGCPSWNGKMPPLALDLFDAVKEQMGLRLERRGTQPVNVLVLDRVERPSPN